MQSIDKHRNTSSETSQREDDEVEEENEVWKK